MWYSFLKKKTGKRRWVLAVLLLFAIAAAPQSKSVTAEYGSWEHPVIKALERHDPGIILFQRSGDQLVQVCLADLANGNAYFITQFGTVFDTLHLTPERKKEILSKKADPFGWFGNNVTQYLPLLGMGKEFLRDNGRAYKKASYAEQKVLTLPGVTKAASPLAKLMAIEDYEKESIGILAHFNWPVGSVADTAIAARLAERVKLGSLIVHGSLDSGYSEFIHTDELSTVRKARLNHATGEVWLYDWWNRPVDSFAINKSKVRALIGERTDIFALYRVWLEWKLQAISVSIPGWQYAANRDLLRRKKDFSYAGADHTASTSSHTLNALKEQKREVRYQIAALSGPDAALLSTFLQARYAGSYASRRRWAGGGWIRSYTYQRGEKRYELTDHRGNVLATVSDRRTGLDVNSDGAIDAYEADVTMATDYYPFGSLMPGRKSDAGKYRYGFNGKENDNEVKGEGNQQDYGMRIYDPRLGRFLSKDPRYKSYPELTPYQFASNTPIQAIDLDGLEGLIATGINGHGMIISAEDARKAVPQIAEYLKSAAHSFVGDVKSLGKLKTYTDGLDGFSLMFTPDVSSHMAENDQKRYETIQGGINTAKNIPNWGPKEWGSATGHLAFQILLSKAIKIAGGAETPVQLKARLNSADAVNAKFIGQGWEAPYVSGVTVAEFKTIAKTNDLVRLSGPNNVKGSWFTTAEEIKGLSSAQLKDKFSLKYEPTSVTPVSIEAGATVRVGEAAAVKNFGTKGGGFQIEVLEGQNNVNYGTTSSLKK